MRFGIVKFPGFPVMAILCLLLIPAFAQTKPPESASKVQRVMLYNKFGGWFHDDGIKQVRAVMASLAAAKGFDLVELDSDSSITPDFLRQFQVIIWNNNTNGAASVPGAAARQAVLDYLDQGGGWLLIHGAADHANSWPGLSTVLGTAFISHALHGQGEVVLDEDAMVHKELKWMLEGIPRILEFKDSWDSYQNTVRPLQGVTVIATARPIRVGTAPGLAPTADGSGDQIYGWAREVGRGRLIFTPLGHGQNQLMAQQDSVIPKLYWQGIRYAAGDFQNGCTLPWDPGFDPAARVLDPAACSGTSHSRIPGLSHPGLRVSRKGQLTRLGFIPGGPFTVRLRDIRGAAIWERNLPAGTGDILLPPGIAPGVHHLEVLDHAHAFRRRLPLP